MDTINISLAQVSSCANAIRTCNNAMYDALQTMKSNMTSLNGSWISEAGELTRNKFLQFANRFDQQKEVIDSYAQFLDLTVNSYDSLESSIVSNGSSLSQ